MKRLAVVGALGVASAALAASPAFAKSDISIQATPHTAHVGHVVKVHGQGDDDAERYTVLVIQERSGKPGHWGHWHAVTRSFNGDARANVKATHTGELQFRSVLYSTDEHHQHAKTDRISTPVTVQVVR
jgi:pantoate kinase